VTRKLFITLTLILLTGCAQQTINADSPANLEASLTQMIQSLDEQKLKKFDRAISYLILEFGERYPELHQEQDRDLDEKAAALKQSLPYFQKINGMTADEVITYARELHMENYPEDYK